MTRKGNYAKRSDISDKDLVYDYFALEMNTVEIGHKYNLDNSTIRDRLIKAGYTLRTAKEAKLIKAHRIIKMPDDEIIRKYVDEKMPSHILAKECGCGTSLLNKKLIELGVTLRNRGDLNKENSDKFVYQYGVDIYNIIEEDLVDKYAIKKLPLTEIAKIYGCNQATIISRLKRYNIPIRESTRKVAQGRKPRDLKLHIQKPAEYFNLPKGEPRDGQLISGKLVGKNGTCRWVKCDVCGKGNWVTVGNLKRYVYGGRCHDCISKSKAYRLNVTNGLYGRYKNPDEHEKSSLATVKMWNEDPIRKEKQDNILRGLSKDDRIIKIRKEWARQYWDDSEFGEVRRKKNGERFGKRARQMWQDDEMRERIGNKMKEKFSDPDVKSLQLKKMWQGQNHKKTKPEIEMENLLNDLYPNQWKYVGDWQVVIEGRCPDFINSNGKKEIIEVFGTYHHGFKHQKQCPLLHELDRKDVYSKYGYVTLIVWEHEMKDKELFRDKVLNFCN